MYAYGNKQSNPDNYDNNTYIVMLIFEEKKQATLYASRSFSFELYFIADYEN